MNHNGLMSDRDMLSDDAARVWQKFFNRTDVEKVELPASLHSKFGEFANYSYIKRPAKRLKGVRASGRLIPLNLPDNELRGLREARQVYGYFRFWLEQKEGVTRQSTSRLQMG